MKYTLIKANPDADRFPAQTRQIIDEAEVNKN
ncbi:NADH-quinone oxidoreductase subunit B, partial [Acinetobacter baumannii]